MRLTLVIDFWNETGSIIVLDPRGKVIKWSILVMREVWRHVLFPQVTSLQVATMPLLSKIFKMLSLLCARGNVTFFVCQNFPWNTRGKDSCLDENSFGSQTVWYVHWSQESSVSVQKFSIVTSNNVWPPTTFYVFHFPEYCPSFGQWILAYHPFPWW